MARRNLLMLLVLPALLVLLVALIWLLLLGGGGEAPTGLPTQTPDAESMRLMPDAAAQLCAARFFLAAPEKHTNVYGPGSI